jgi:hypothetical protein
MEMEEVSLVFVRMRVLLALRNMPASAMRLWNSDKKNVHLRHKGKHFCRLHTPWEWILRRGNCLLGSLGLVWLLLVVGEGQRLGQLQSGGQWLQVMMIMGNLDYSAFHHVDGGPGSIRHVEPKLCMSYCTTACLWEVEVQGIVWQRF